MYLPIELCSKIVLYNSTVLCDLFKSRLKVNSLMTLFRLNNGRYKRLLHYQESRYGNKWSEQIESIKVVKGWLNQCHGVRH